MQDIQNHVRNMQNCNELHKWRFWLWFQLWWVLLNVFFFVMCPPCQTWNLVYICLNVKFIVKMVKKLFLATDLGHISRVQSQGPGQQLWFSNIPGQAKSCLRPKVRPGLAWLLASGQSWHITTCCICPFCTYIMWHHGINMCPHPSTIRLHDLSLLFLPSKLSNAMGWIHS